MRARMKLALLVTAVATALASASTAQGAVSVGHSGWYWGNPTPQGHTLTAIEFSGLRGYAAGAFGTLLRTDDGGSTWRGVPTGLTSPIERIRLIGKETVIVGGRCSVRRSDDGGASFARLPFTTSDTSCRSEVASFAFPGATVGYVALDDGSVLRTSNGGQSFQRRTAVPGTRAAQGGATLNDIFFKSNDVGLAVTSDGSIFGTPDGGTSWTLVRAAAKSLTSIYFVDAQTGFALGAQLTLLKTTDSGVTWTEKTVPTFENAILPDELTSIRCNGAQTCLLTTRKGQQLLRSTDAGETFGQTTASNDALYAVGFASATRAVAVGLSGTTVLSDDAGATFAGLGQRLGTPRLTRVKATSASVAHAAGTGGLVLRTEDAGASWQELPVPTSDHIVDFAFPTRGTGYVLDGARTLQKTTDGGAGWAVVDIGGGSLPRAIEALSDDILLLVGPRGIRRSTDGGDTFSTVADKDVAGVSLSRVDRAGSAVLAYSATRVVISTNAGASWTPLPKLPKGVKLLKADFITPRSGYAIDANGRLIRTRDGGRKWVELPAVGTRQLADLAFGSAASGWVMLYEGSGLRLDTSGGYLLRTANSGKTFRPQLIDDGFQLAGVSAGSASAGFVLGLANRLFATQSGGDQGTAAALTLSTPKRLLAKPGTIEIKGTLTPPEGREQVVVSMRRPKQTGWTSRLVTAASNGSFTFTQKVGRGTTLFVAQWRGDDARQGAGSSELAVTVRPKRRR